MSPVHSLWLFSYARQFGFVKKSLLVIFHHAVERESSSCQSTWKIGNDALRGIIWLWSLTVFMAMILSKSIWVFKFHEERFMKAENALVYCRRLLTT
jgi:hypothetical protein